MRGKAYKKENIVRSAFLAVTLLFVVFMMLSTRCASNQNSMDKRERVPFQKPYTLLVSADLHYQRNLTKMHALIMHQMRYNHEIVDTFFSEVEERAPDALLLCGDNTDAGNEQDHADLIEPLSAIKEQGTDVIMAFGSHDLMNFSRNEIKRQYADLIFDDAISTDETTLSYIYPISPELWILVLDPYIKIDHLHLSDETIEWMVSYLDLARENHTEIIAMSHYGVTPSKETNEQFAVIDNNNRVLNLFEKYDVSLYLSGHRHKQALKKQKMPTRTIYELISNTLINYPNIYGEINITEYKELTYHAKYLDVSSYARANHLRNPDLLNFSAFSQKAFLDQTNKSIAGTLMNFDLRKDQVDEMRGFAVRILYSYAANTFYREQKNFKRALAYQLWKKQNNPPYGYGRYFEYLLTTPARDNNNFSFNLNEN
jgi:predicted MPP superfamily phosphohydrolase